MTEIVTTNYVLGFAISADKAKIVLIRKNRPAWQVGKLNVPGGKIEGDEDPMVAIAREFAEETGVTTQPDEWTFFAELKLLHGTIYCYRLYDDKILQARTMEEEDILIRDVDISAISKESVSNCGWLIGIALDDNALLNGVTANYLQGEHTGYIKADHHGSA